jgi:hypothetical protein
MPYETSPWRQRLHTVVFEADRGTWVATITCCAVTTPFSQTT